MIHDCGSFILEYLYTGNPVMYLVKDENIDSKWNETYQKAYHLHYKAKTKEEIERFIQNVISGKDNLKAKREAFMDENLIPLSDRQPPKTSSTVSSPPTKPVLCRNKPIPSWISE